MLDCGELMEDIQQRELYFVGNSLNGMKEYVFNMP